MARKIVLKENGLDGTPNTPSGYKYLGDSGGDISEKVGATVSALGGGGSSTLYSETTISSGDILNFQTTPVTILSAPGSNSYNIIKDIALEFNHNTSAYDVGNAIYVRVYFSAIGATFNTPLWYVEAQSLLENANNRVVYLHATGLQNNVDGIVRDGSNANTLTSFNTDLVIDSSGAINDAFGSDGTLLVKVWYETRTFGTEL